MSAAAQLAHVDVFLLLHNNAGQVLFGRRSSRVWAGGQWNLVSGKVDEGEDALTAMIREAREEIGIRLYPDDLRFAGVVHLLQDVPVPRVGFGMHATYDPDRHGPVVNGEPDKCDELRWADPATAPQPFEPYNAAVLAVGLGPEHFAVVGD